MVLPAVIAAEAAKKGPKTVEGLLSMPVIGKRTTVTYVDKKGRTVTEETSVQLRAWEVALFGAVAAATAYVFADEIGIEPMEKGADPIRLALRLGGGLLGNLLGD